MTCTEKSASASPWADRDHGAVDLVELDRVRGHALARALDHVGRHVDGRNAWEGRCELSRETPHAAADLDALPPLGRARSGPNGVLKSLQSDSPEA